MTGKPSLDLSRRPDAALQRELETRFNPEGSDLRRMQHRMTEMLRVIDGICRRHGLRYWLCSGTLLGAVRHEGYIPWDDDLDIEMMRPDYDRLMEILPRELPKDMVLQNARYRCRLLLLLRKSARLQQSPFRNARLRPHFRASRHLHRHFPLRENAASPPAGVQSHLRTHI